MLVAVPAALAGLYLLVLAATAAVAPDRARRFLAGFASSAAKHYLEQAARILVGASLLLSAPGMLFPDLFRVFGWMLVGTSLLLCAVPWRVHQRLAGWVVSQASKRLALIRLGAFGGGLLLLLSLFLGPGAV